jgi:SRSO17 transposase
MPGSRPMSMLSPWFLVMPIGPLRSDLIARACCFRAIGKRRTNGGTRRAGTSARGVPVVAHFVAKADWSDDAVLSAVRANVLPTIERHGTVRAWIIDDTGVPKTGTHSVGVAPQYCDQLGKQDNRPLAVTLSVANDPANLPVAHHLHFTASLGRRSGGTCQGGCAGRGDVPDQIGNRARPHLRGFSGEDHAATVLADAGYGVDAEFPDGITALCLPYVVGVHSPISLWPPGVMSLPPKKWSGNGRPPSLNGRDCERKPVSAKRLAIGLPARAWRRVT